jgi:predicted lipid carrier protein YhbT
MEEKVKQEKIQKLEEMIEDKEPDEKSNRFLSSFVHEVEFRWILARANPTLSFKLSKTLKTFSIKIYI